jgi:hypothetical protein
MEELKGGQTNCLFRQKWQLYHINEYKNERTENIAAKKSSLLFMCKCSVGVLVQYIIFS